MEVAVRLVAHGRPMLGSRTSKNAGVFSASGSSLTEIKSDYKT